MARVEVGLAARPEAVARPWGALTSAGATRALPADVRLVDVYDECRTGLLVLGEPGAGKTTALLELTRDLLCRAERDPGLPVPVVFHLSSWAAEHTCLTEWLGTELTKRYGVPPGLARDWVRTEAVLPLLDGLDEVDQARRDACVAAINDWRDEHGLFPAVVCSRTADYDRLAQRLRLASAVALQPLSRSAVTGYLRAAGRPMAGVRALLARDDRLWELLTTPLMLSVVVLAYARVPATRIRADGDTGTRRHRLLTDYVTAMLTRPRRGLAQDRAPYPPDQTLRWLSWLADRMSRRHESVFYPDWLQVSALDRRSHRVRVVAQPALLVGLATAVAAVLVAEVVQLAGGRRSVEHESWLFPLLFGAVAALACGRRRITPARPWQRRAVARVVRAPIAGAVAGLGTILVSDWVLLAVPLEGWQPLSGYYLGFLLLGGLAGGLATRAVASLPRGASRCPEDLAVSSRIGALVSMNVIAVFVSIRLLDTTGGVTVPVLVWSVLQLVLFGGAVALSRPGAELTPAMPGEAMRRTRDQAIAAGVAVALFVAVVWHGLDVFGGYLGAQWETRWHTWPVTALQAQVILLTGWLTTVAMGLADYLRHRAVLRLLARHGHLPADLLGFLDHADSHILLRRAGGGYTFVHRLFLDHFARSGRGLDRGEDRAPGCLSGRPE